MKTILIVDDEVSVIKSLRFVLKEDYNVIGTNNGKEALQIIEKEHIALMILDIRMPDMDGMELLRRLQAMRDDLGVIMLTAVNDIKTIIKAVKLGALDYIVKPFKHEEIKLVVQKALQYKNLKREVNFLRLEYKNRSVNQIIYGQSKLMEDVIGIISRISRVNSTVLIRGESGTGKELVARAIHFDSERRNNPFVVVSCPNLTGELLENELFGHEKGAFTGAYERKLGKFEIAEGGTLFLDEISEISLALQAKLLRVLQEREFSRLGGNSLIKTDVRIIAATNKDLEEKVKEGKFREDLYYRINVVPVYLPPVRERKEDIPILVEHFYNVFRKECNAMSQFISQEAMRLLREYDWPGNVREIKNVMERTVALHGNEPILLPSHLPVEMSGISSALNNVKPKSQTKTKLSLDEAVQQLEKQLIKQALRECNGIKSRVAKQLGTTRSIIQYKIKKYGIHSNDNYLHTEK